MTLPDELEDGLWKEIHKIEGEKKMEYISSVERIGIKKGMEKGIEQGTLKLLSRLIARRFHVSIDSLHPIFDGLITEQLEELGERLLEAESLDQIRGLADEMRNRG